MRGGKKVGRDHNAKGMAMWMAGGGVKAGHAIGATDEIGEAAVDVAHPIKDLHVTLLHFARPRRQQAHVFPRRAVQATQPNWR